MKRILALDVGTLRTGVAISDPLHIVATGLDTIEEADVDQLILQISSLCEKNEVGEIVVGMPYNMDGSTGEQAVYVEKFIDQLKQKIDLQVHIVDERLTSETAMDLLMATRKKKKQKKIRQNKHLVDKMSAVIILQDFLGR